MVNEEYTYVIKVINNNTHEEIANAKLTSSTSTENIQLLTKSETESLTNIIIDTLKKIDKEIKDKIGIISSAYDINKLELQNITGNRISYTGSVCSINASHLNGNSVNDLVTKTMLGDYMKTSTFNTFKNNIELKIDEIETNIGGNDSGLIKKSNDLNTNLDTLKTNINDNNIELEKLERLVTEVLNLIDENLTTTS